MTTRIKDAKKKLDKWKKDMKEELQGEEGEGEVEEEEAGDVDIEEGDEADVEGLGDGEGLYSLEVGACLFSMAVPSKMLKEQNDIVGNQQGWLLKSCSAALLSFACTLVPAGSSSKLDAQVPGATITRSISVHVGDWSVYSAL